MNETNILQSIRVRLSNERRHNACIFRNNVGTLRDDTGRVVRFGLCRGSSDLIGWKRVTVTPDMVGKPVAVFVAIEVKTQTGRTTPDQDTFLARVAADGGIAGVARSADDADMLMGGEA